MYLYLDKKISDNIFIFLKNNTLPFCKKKKIKKLFSIWLERLGPPCVLGSDQLDSYTEKIFDDIICLKIKKEELLIIKLLNLNYYIVLNEKNFNKISKTIYVGYGHNILIKS